MYDLAYDSCLQPIPIAAADRTKQQIVEVLGSTNRRYITARTMTVSPFALPPAARNSHIVVQGEKAGYGKLKGSEVARLMRTLPHILESVEGCERGHAAMHFCRKGPDSGVMCCSAGGVEASSGIFLREPSQQ